ncbi:MAG: prolyl oligopeptidase family serine peptidase, partial [Opitutales bacterium]|nr:prolyl oligopeptidase family serine peptidase [Opitutales bacterium]
MVNIFKRCFIFITLFFALAFLNAAEKIRVACIGDSITAGACVKGRENFYPSKLQAKLGDGYEVRNFGVSGRTMLSKGDSPYINDGAWKRAQEFNPNIVIIKLGTNDTKPQNMVHFSEFEADMKAIVETLQALPAKPKIYLSYPVCVTRMNWGINDPCVRLKVIPTIDKIAKEKNLEIIDFYNPTFALFEIYAEGVHPNNAGADFLAEIAAAKILGKTPPPPAKRAFMGGVELWNGFVLHKGEFSDGKLKRELIIVEPKLAAEGKPWILRPAFFGHEPQTDIALLNLGWHVVYLDMTNDCATDQILEFGKLFYDYMTTLYGFSKKVVFEGMSRGGFYSLRFAAKYPECVGSLYIDAPVCDLSSITEPNFWNDALKKWDANLDNYKTKILPYQPANNLKKLAENKVPILSVCGDADKVVPIEKNSLIVKAAYERLGGKFELITKPGVDHHPHSLKDPAPIVDFITKNQPGYDRAKYEKAAAGIKEKPLVDLDFSKYMNLRGSLNNSRLKFESGEATVAFLGGSITEMNGWRNFVQRELKKRYPNTKFNFIEAGISSTGSTPHAFRLESDILQIAKPDLLFFEASVNDHTNGFTKDEQIKGVEGVIAHALKANPNMDIVYLHFIYEPTRDEKMQGITPEVYTNQEAVCKHYNIPSIDLISAITDELKAQKINWHEFGGTHPAPLGHEYYTAAIMQLFDKLQTKAKNIKPHKLPKAKLDKFSYTNGRFIDINSAKIKSGWRIDEKWQPTLRAGTRKGFAF